MASPTLHPQFFSTLVPGFRTHLTIPVDSFSKYIEGKSVEKIAKLKSDVIWEVKMTGRRLSSGWEEFAVAHNLQIGNVVVVIYEGDLLFHVSYLGPSCCEIQDIPTPSNNNGISVLMKKLVHPRTQVDFSSKDDDEEEDNMELPRKKKVKKNNPDSSSPENSSFVALVTALNLRTDTLNLPQHFTSSNDFTRTCQKIVLTDGGERSWELDLRFNKSFDTFYITRGWRSFCDENGQKAEGFFMFKLARNGETLVLSFCPTESVNDRRKRDCSEASGRESLSLELNSQEENKEAERSEDECSEEENIEGESSEDECSEEENIEGKSSKDEWSEEENIEWQSSEDECSALESLREIEKKKYSLKQTSYLSYSPYHKRFVKFTLPPDYVRIEQLALPKLFLRENGIDKPREMYLLGKDGTKWPTKLHLDKQGTMRLGKGWKDLAKANGLKTSFMLKLIWEDTTPLLSLCSTDSSSDRGQEEFSKAIEKQSLFVDPSDRDKLSKDENNKEESRSLERKKNHLRGRDSTPPSQKQFVTFSISQRW